MCIQGEPRVYNQHCILLATPDQSMERTGIRSCRLADLDRGGGAVELHLWWTAGTAALCSQAGSALPRALAQVPHPVLGPRADRSHCAGEGMLAAAPGDCGCSSSQFIPLLLAANAGAPLAVHEGPAAQGPDGVEHRVCHGFTGCGEGEDGQVRTGTLGWLRAGWEHPSPSPALSSMGFAIGSVGCCLFSLGTALYKS